MVELPTNEDLNNYRVGEAVNQVQKDFNKEDNDDSYLENELELKGLLLNLKAKGINPMLNQTDLVCGTITDKIKMKELEWYLDFSIDCYEAGLFESAKFCADKVLTGLNFRRSENGDQQKLLITRVKAQQLDLNKEKTGGFIKTRLRE